MRELKIGYLIGALNVGGSERQLSELAVGMTGRGHKVEVLCYDGAGAFDAYVERRGVTVHRLAAGNKLRKTRNAKRWLRTFRPDVVHGFMKRASSLAVLANLPGRSSRVVASDFSTATYDPRQRALRVALQLFRFADRVATQTEVNRRSLIQLAPWLESKVTVIRNGVDIGRFQPSERDLDGPFTFLCVGTVWRAKNPVNLVKAAGILRKKVERPFRVVWVGRFRQGASGEEFPEYRLAMDLIRAGGLEDTVSFVGESETMEKEYRCVDVLLHASIQDGIPNAVVEGMASGLPLVASRVSDLPLIVREGNNGMLCEAQDPDSIAGAMAQMLALDVEERREMGRRSRDLAEKWFGMGRFVDDYECLYRELLGLVK